MQATSPSTGGRRQWQAFAGAGLAAAVLYVADVSPLVTTLAFALIGIGTVWASFAGPRHFGAEPRVAWRLIGVAALLFLVGVVVRPWTTTQPPPISLLADAVTIPGYVMVGVILVILLRARQSVERHAVLDGLIVCASAGLVSVLLLAVPAAALPDQPIQSMLAAVYPLFDVLLSLMVINLTFTTTTWPPSLVTFLGTLLLLFAGDLAYAILAASGSSYTSPWLDLPFLVAYVLLGVTALHPSVVRLSRAERRPAQAWSPQRMSVLAPAIATPFVLLVAVGDRSPAYRLAIGVTGAAIVALLLMRASSAVQAQVAAQLHSEYQSRHDPLTGLPNRRMISTEIQRLVAGLPADGPDRVWVYLLDLDSFKWVNDSWGHDTGDQLVIEAAARLHAAVPPATMLARVGGDEFLLTYVGAQHGALRLADEIRGCLSGALPVRDTEVVISASIGIAHAAGGCDPAITAEALLRDADTAMYRAKSEGPGRSTVFDTSMHDRVRERIELELALRTALAEGQLHVAYQPIVQLGNGRPVGAEALARWHHPARGMIPPDRFVPIAEDAGLIGAIGTWVREEAIRQLAQWRADGTVADDFYLSVNVSPRQLSDADLPLTVSADLLRFGVPARALVLEMTESVMVDGSSVTARVLHELRELGVRLLIDDFGTGFSALGYLRRFPISGVKIDRSFVSGLGHSLEDEEIVRSVVAMSYALGLSVVGEGVETALQRDALAAVGVSHGQGWLWGPAVPAVEFAARWHAGRPAAREASTAHS